MKHSPPSPTALRVAALSQKAPNRFDLRPDEGARAALAAELDLLGLRKLSFSGEITAEGASDWRLSGTLGATVVQPCGVTLAPVSTRIDVAVTRLYQRDFAMPDAPEVEMPEDDTTEPLGVWIDPDDVMREALVLNLPLYPRAPGAGLEETVVTEPGVQPLRDADLRPFAGLASLRDRMDRDPEAGEE
jgi:uncharacterized metal-binding protein YceD (DUF177 family)